MIEPAQLQARPHYGRFPIPFVTYVDETGRPDFKVHDNDQRLRCARRRLCQLCGQRMEGVVAFVGFEHSVERGVFGEPPMHDDCLAWAWEVCPWLAGGNWREEWSSEARNLIILRPPATGSDAPLGVYRAATYRVIEDDEGSGGVKWEASDPVSPVEWRSR